VVADDAQALEVDEHVLEALGVLAGRAHAGTEDADVDGDGQAQLGAEGVDGVVQPVVERVLVDERCDPYEGHGGVGREVAQALALAHGVVGAVDHQRDAQAVRVPADLIEEILGALGREPGRHDADVDPAGVHDGEQLLEHLERGGGGDVTAPEVGEALEARLGVEGLGGGATDGVDPEVDDRHAGGASGVVSAWGAWAVCAACAG
jgi:hypothetical protein